MKNKLTTIFGTIASFAIAGPQILVQNGITISAGVQKWFSLAALIAGTAFGIVAKDKNVTGAGDSAKVVN